MGGKRKDRTSTSVQITGRTIANLQEDLVVVSYEISMITRLAKEYDPGWRNSPDEMVRCRNNAYCESFAIHCRQLIHFFFAHLHSERYPTDVLAVDFVWSWKDLKTTLHRDLEEPKTRADIEVAHITTHRGGRNQGDESKTYLWDMPTLAKILCDIMWEFVNLLRNEKPEYFTERAEALFNMASSRFS